MIYSSFQSRYGHTEEGSEIVSDGTVGNGLERFPEDIRRRYTADDGDLNDDVEDTDIVRGHLELLALQHSIGWTGRELRAQSQAFLDLTPDMSLGVSPDLSPDMSARLHQAQENILHVSIALAEYKQAVWRVTHRWGW